MSSHDLGGQTDDDLRSLDLTDADRQYEHWERSVHALEVLLVSKKFMTVDEMRRGIEALPSATYETWGYYEKWAASMASVLIERGILGPSELDEALGVIGSDNNDNAARVFAVGDRVTVRNEASGIYWRKPHLRVPGYVFGATGIVERTCGRFADPEFTAYRSVRREEHLYRIRFAASDLWPVVGGDNGGGGGPHRSDTVDVEIYEPWIVAAAVKASTASDCADAAEAKEEQDGLEYKGKEKGHNAHNHDGHDHEGHDHVHEDRVVVEQNAVDREAPETIGRRVAETLVSLCIRKELVSASELTAAVEEVDRLGTVGANQDPIGPQIVAKAWIDDEFRKRLIDDANAALSDIGICASNSTAATKLTAVENTDTVHNVVVCTLCSCYPLSILGLSPPWYKSRSYRARVVREPREVLREFGTEVSDEVCVRVHDSTADLRYIVIPRRPDGTEGWDENDLRRLVSRDSMVGVRTAISTVELDTA